MVELSAESKLDLAFKRIRELEEIVKLQEERIATLELKTRSSGPITVLDCDLHDHEGWCGL